MSKRIEFATSGKHKLPTTTKPPHTKSLNQSISLVKRLPVASKCDTILPMTIGSSILWSNFRQHPSRRLAWTIHETRNPFTKPFYCSEFCEGAEYGLYFRPGGAVGGTRPEQDTLQPKGRGKIWTGRPVISRIVQARSSAFDDSVFQPNENHTQPHKICIRIPLYCLQIQI